MIFFNIIKKKILFWQFQNALNSFKMTLALIFGVNQDVIWINNNKNIKLFG